MLRCASLKGPEVAPNLCQAFTQSPSTLCRKATRTTVSACSELTLRSAFQHCRWRSKYPNAGKHIITRGCSPLPSRSKPDKPAGIPSHRCWWCQYCSSRRNTSLRAHSCRQSCRLPIHPCPCHHPNAAGSSLPALHACRNGLEIQGVVSMQSLSAAYFMETRMTLSWAAASEPVTLRGVQQASTFRIALHT